MSQGCWSLFKDTLQKPYQIDESIGEIEFPQLKAILNIQNLLYTNSYHGVVFAQPHRLFWQSTNNETEVTWRATASTYGDDIGACQASHCEAKYKGSVMQDMSHQLVFSVAGKMRLIDVVPSVVHTWPKYLAGVDESRRSPQRPSASFPRLPVEVLNHIADYLQPFDRLSLMLTSKSPPLTETQIAHSTLWSRVLRKIPWIERVAKEYGIDLLLLGPDIGQTSDNSHPKPYVFLSTFPVSLPKDSWFGDRGLWDAMGQSKPETMEYELPDMMLNLEQLFSRGGTFRLPFNQLDHWTEKEIFSSYYSSSKISRVEVRATTVPNGCGTDFDVHLNDGNHASIIHCYRNGIGLMKGTPEVIAEWRAAVRRHQPQLLTLINSST